VTDTLASVRRLTPKTLAGLEIQPVQQRSRWLNILIYGDSGTGKTTLSGSADAVPALRPVLVIDIEGGTESLRHSYPDVETVRVTTWKKMQEVYNALHEGEGGYNTVILDSLTEIQKFDMYNIMSDVVQRRPDLNPDVPSMREWGINLEHIRRMVRGFRDLEMNTIFTALAKESKNDKTGQVTVKPSLSGKMADEVAAFLDIVGYYYVKQIGDGSDAEFKRLLLTQKTDAQVAKDRTGKLPMILEAPTMRDIYSRVDTRNNTPETETKTNTEEK
jgi:hypothetical protein